MGDGRLRRLERSFIEEGEAALEPLKRERSRVGLCPECGAVLDDRVGGYPDSPEVGDRYIDTVTHTVWVYIGGCSCSAWQRVTAALEETT